MKEYYYFKYHISVDGKPVTEKKYESGWGLQDPSCKFMVNEDGSYWKEPNHDAVENSCHIVIEEIEFVRESPHIVLVYAHAYHPEAGIRARVPLGQRVSVGGYRAAVNANLPWLAKPKYINWDKDKIKKDFGSVSFLVRLIGKFRTPPAEYLLGEYKEFAQQYEGVTLPAFAPDEDFEVI